MDAEPITSDLVPLLLLLALLFRHLHMEGLHKFSVTTITRRHVTLCVLILCMPYVVQGQISRNILLLS